MASKAEEAAIEIRRLRELHDWPFAYTGWIDDHEVGQVANGGTQRYGIRPGKHGVQVGISGRWLGSGRFWTSETREADVPTASRVVLTCWPTSVTAVTKLIRPGHRLQLSKGEPDR